MKRAGLVPLVTAWFCAAAPAVHGVFLDPAESTLAVERGQPLRWDNVEGWPHLVSGVLSSRAGDADSQRIVLRPGEETQLWLPEGEGLRLRSPSRTLGGGDLVVSVSDGSGLFREMSLPPIRQGKDVQVRIPGGGPAVFSLRHPGGRDEVTAVEVYHGRRVQRPESLPARELVALDAPAVRIGRFAERPGSQFYRIAAGQAVSFQPAELRRLAFDLRLRLDAAGAGELRRFRFDLELDGAFWKSVDLRTAPERRQAMQVDGTPALLGREETVWLQVPEPAGVVTLRPSAPLLLRVRGYRHNDFLLPELNVPFRALREYLEGGLELETGAVHRRHWASATPHQLEAFARTLARDNRVREGGLAATAVMEHLQRREPGLRGVARAVQQVRGGATFWKNLEPVSAPLPGARAARVIEPQLRDPGESAERFLAAASQAPAYLSELAEGVFHRLRAGGPEMRYPVPERAFPTWLKIAVPADFRGRLRLEFDNGETETLVARGRTALRPTAWHLGPGETGLLLAGHLESAHAWGGIDAPAVSRPALPVMEVQTLQLELPVRVRGFSVRMLEEGDDEWAEARVATWYRKARAWTLDEWDYLYRLDEYLGPGRAAGLLSAALRRVLDCTAADPVGACPPAEEAAGATPDGLSGQAARDLLNDWVPLLRLLRARWDVFAGDIAGPGEPVPAEGQSSAKAARHIEAARALVAEGDHLAALENWFAAAAHAGPEQLRIARLGQVDALSALGEDFRAERMLRSLLIHDRDPALRDAAAGRLATRYRDEHRVRMLTGVRIAQFRADPGSATLGGIVAALLEEGAHDPALRAGLALRRESRPEGLSSAAWQLQWHRALQRILVDQESSAQNLWSGIGAAADGHMEAAQEAFSTAGKAMRPWADALRTGLEIRRGLAAQDVDLRRQAVRDWLHWWAAHPGPRHPGDGGIALRDAAGTQPLYVPARDLTFDMIRALPGRPAEFEVVGPVTLDLDVRPLHAAEGTAAEGPWEPADGSVQVSVASMTQTHPWSGNLPAESIAPIDATLRAGNEVALRVDVPEGIQRVRVAPRDGAILVAARAMAPTVALPVLPWPSPDLVAAVLAHPLPGTVRARDRSQPVLVRHGAVARLGVGSFVTLADGITESREAPVDVETARASGRETRIAERMDALQQAWVEQPSGRHRVLPVAARIAHEHGEEPRVQSIWSRITRDGVEWRLLPSVYRSAGVRREPVIGWDPESPVLRARRAMMAELPAGVEVLHGAGVVMLEMENLAPVRLRVRLQGLRLAAEPDRDHRVAWSLDGERESIVGVEPGQGASFQLAVPAGRHFLRFRLADPEPGRYVALQFEEQRAPGVWTLLAIERERTFHVATRAEPVVLRIDGPAWIRIDEYRGDTRRSRFLFVEKPGTEHVLRPAAGEDEAALRIFQLVPGRPAPRYASLVPVAGSLPVADVSQPPSAQWVGAPEPAGRLAIPDQEDGTLSLYASAKLRRDTDPEGSGAAGAGRLRSRDFGIQHRYRDDAAERYWFHEAFIREPWDGEPLLGLRSRIDRYPPQSPFDWGGQAELNLQEFPGADPLAWSGTLRGFLRYNTVIDPSTSHSARLSGFLRQLSLSPGDATRGEPDPDIYSTYKQDHQHGIGLGWTVRHAPWRDTLWEGALGVNSNENLDVLSPDHHSARVAWRQLLGDGVLGLDYRFRHFENDRDRGARSSRNDLSLEFGWEAWRQDSQRFELQMTAQRDFERNQWLGQLSLIWHIGEGREYRDFRPGEIEFRDLRELRAPDEWNGVESALP